MNSAIYTAYSGLKAQSEALEILANNLANLNTSAFKEETAFYTYLNPSAEASQSSGDMNTVINQSVQVRSALNLEGGSLSATGRDLDIALEGSGFLVVDTPRGIRYTRNGSLGMSKEFVLTTSDGLPILGVNNRPITLGPGKINIGENGDISLDNLKTNQLKIVSFEDVSVLEKEGGALFRSRADRGSEKISDAKIKSGYLEQSNVNPVASIARMVEVMRHFEAIQKTISLEMNEINSKVIEKLGR